MSDPRPPLPEGCKWSDTLPDEKDCGVQLVCPGDRRVWFNDPPPDLDIGLGGLAIYECDEVRTAPLPEVLAVLQQAGALPPSVPMDEAIRIASTLPVPPATVREWLDDGLSEAVIRDHVDTCMEHGLDPGYYRIGSRIPPDTPAAPTLETLVEKFKRDTVSTPEERERALEIIRSVFPADVETATRFDGPGPYCNVCGKQDHEQGECLATEPGADVETDDARRRGFEVGSPEHVALWEAVNEYADAGRGVYGNTKRMDAVVRVERALVSIREAEATHLRTRVETLEADRGAAAVKSTEVHRLRGQDHARTAELLWETQRERDTYKAKVAANIVEISGLRTELAEARGEAERLRQTNRTFPVQTSYDRKKQADYAGVPTDVPWSLVAPFAGRARENHDQTLERLAERGGLSPMELWCLLNNCGLRPIVDRSVTPKIAADFIKKAIREHDRPARTEVNRLREALAEVMAEWEPTEKDPQEEHCPDEWGCNYCGNGLGLGHDPDHRFHDAGCKYNRLRTLLPKEASR